MRWLILMLIFLNSCQSEAPTQSVRPVRAVQVSESSLSGNQIVFPGTLRAFKRADLSFRVDGIVILRDITVGYVAKKDETLMRLDPREYEIALDKAKGKVESTQAQLDFASRDYQRMKNIYQRDPGAISASFLDRKMETVNQLKAELGIAHSDRDKAADDLSYTVLKAPFDGIVAAIYVENHEQVRAKQAVLRFLDTAEREMEINVPQKYINLILERKAALHFEVALDAIPQQLFPAAIKEIGTEASSTTQTYPVTLSLLNIPNQSNQFSLLAGMSGRATLTQLKEKTSPVYKIPKSAIFAENGHVTYVWTVDPKTERVHKTAVELEESFSDDQALVKEGLVAGDWVVTAGTSFLFEGQLVKLVAEPPAA